MVHFRVHSDDVYKLFLQAVMSRRVMSERVTKLIWRKCTEVVADAAPDFNVTFDGSLTAWNDFVDKINKSLDPFDLEFKTFVDEVTSVKMYMIVNTKGDEIAQLASDYSPTEIAFFKAIVEQIFLAPNRSFSVSSLAALREISHLKTTSMTKAQGEVMLASFVARGWLLRSKRGRYSLAPRALLELGGYLKGAYPDIIVECTICLEMVTKGFACATENCQAALHKHCYEVYRRTKGLCLACQKDWGVGDAGVKPIGEAAAKEGQDDRRRVRRESTNDGDENDESQYMSQTQPDSQFQSQSQNRKDRGRGANKAKKTNGKSKKRNETPPETDEEEDEVEDNVMDIDDLSQIKEKSSRLHRRS